MEEMKETLTSLLHAALWKHLNETKAEAFRRDGSFTHVRDTIKASCCKHYICDRLGERFHVVQRCSEIIIQLLSAHSQDFTM